MDPEYDKVAAKNALDALIEDKLLSSNVGSNLAGRDLMTNTAQFIARKSGNPACYRLLNANAELNMSDELEDVEAILRVQGIISIQHLQTSVRSPHLGGNLPEHHITLTGLSASTFDQIIANIETIDADMAREVDQDLWMPWAAGTFEGNRTISMSNRMLTPSGQCPDASTTRIPAYYDRLGTLESLTIKGGYRYLPENDVKLFVKTKDGSYLKARPTNFQAGDIVEVQLSFLILKTRTGMKRMKVVLRSIALEDDSYTKAAQRKRADQANRKRKRGEEGEGVYRKIGLRSDVGYGEMAKVTKRVENIKLRTEEGEWSSEDSPAVDGLDIQRK